jgi:hypothetical protein
MSAPDLPARIDRAAVERIIQRAAELQTGEREIGEGLTDAEVLALGKEVGIPERYLRQAILEEQSRSPLPAALGVLDRVIGPATVAAQRVVQGRVEDLEQALLRWMEEEELLELQRQQPGRITWEPLRAGRATLRRLTSRRPFMLAKASLVSATITALEPGYAHVALTADIRTHRSSTIGGVAAAASFGVAGAVILGVMSPLIWVAAAPIPFAVALGWGLARTHRPIAERTQLGLERALDHLERGAIKPGHQLPPRTSIAGAVIDEVRRALGGPTS